MATFLFPIEIIVRPVMQFRAESYVYLLPLESVYQKDFTGAKIDNCD